MKLINALKFRRNIFVIEFKNFEKFFQNLSVPFILNLFFFNPFEVQKSLNSDLLVIDHYSKTLFVFLKVPQSLFKLCFIFGSVKFCKKDFENEHNKKLWSVLILRGRTAIDGGSLLEIAVLLVFHGEHLSHVV